MDGSYHNSQLSLCTIMISTRNRNQHPLGQTNIMPSLTELIFHSERALLVLTNLLMRLFRIISHENIKHPDLISVYLFQNTLIIPHKTVIGNDFAWSILYAWYQRLTAVQGNLPRPVNCQYISTSSEFTILIQINVQKKGKGSGGQHVYYQNLNILEKMATIFTLIWIKMRLVTEL